MVVGVFSVQIRKILSYCQFITSFLFLVISELCSLLLPSGFVTSISLFASCQFALKDFSVHFAGWHALILTSSLLIFRSLDCAASLALLSHFVIVILMFIFAVFFVSLLHISVAFCLLWYLLFLPFFFAAVLWISYVIHSNSFALLCWGSGLLIVTNCCKDFLSQRLPFTFCVGHPTVEVS